MSASVARDAFTPVMSTAAVTPLALAEASIHRAQGTEDAAVPRGRASGAVSHQRG